MKPYSRSMGAWNVDPRVVDGFGDEWAHFDQTELTDKELEEVFAAYFSIFPWNKIPRNAIGFDLGCGSGRWAKFVASRVGKLFCVDPSEKALKVARKNLAALPNCQFVLGTADHLPINQGEADFGYAIGVLHHVPNTERDIVLSVSKLKPGAPFLVYLYYNFDGFPNWFKAVWRISEIGRLLISRTPFRIRFFLSQLIAFFVYFPLARISLWLEKLGVDIRLFPLSFYRNKSFYFMRTDALDRFGTRLQKRFTKVEMRKIMEKAGLGNIEFSDKPPFWCAVGYKK